MMNILKNKSFTSFLWNIEMPTSKGKSILIVDDDEDLTNLYETFLKYDGYRVDAFTDPIDALSSFRKMDMILFYSI